jgi:hypothetical protein
VSTSPSLKASKINDTDLKKLSTDEQAVLDVLTRKRGGKRVPELLAACEQVRELARTLRTGKHVTPGGPPKVTPEDRP